MDKVVDDYSPVVICLEQDIEELEEVVFTGSVAPSERIYSRRREATELYRAMHPLVMPLDAITRGSLLGVGETLRPFFRDISDHLKLAQEDVAQQRDQLAVMMQANLAVISLEQNDISVRQSEISKQLTVIGDGVPAADVPHRLLRDELRLANGSDQLTVGIPRVRPRQLHRLAVRAVPVLPPARLLPRVTALTTSYSFLTVLYRRGDPLVP
jgi:CorA-like Mg2+ transporter protein